jgi:1-acyl-sn-glycerol-3-phosphate acyltransferase
MIQWLRSLVFVGQMYAMMAVLAVFYTPWAIVDRRGAFAGVHAYTRWVRWTASWMVGPQDRGARHAAHGRGPDRLEASELSRHHHDRLGRAAPEIHHEDGNSNGPPSSAGTRSGSAASRGPRQARRGHSPDDEGRAGRDTDARAADHLSSGHPRRPGRREILQDRTAILYEETGQTCIPAATNVGVFWPRTGIYRKPGVAVVEFLPPIEQGLSQKAFMERLEADIETASDRLLEEAGFHAED